MTRFKITDKLSGRRLLVLELRSYRESAITKVLGSLDWDFRDDYPGRYLVEPIC